MEDNEYLIDTIKECFETANCLGYTDIIELLLDRGFNIPRYTEEALNLASYYGYIETIELMLNRGVDIHNNNDSPLFYAIKSGNLKVVKILIDKGANVNVLWNYLQINCHNEYPIQ